MKTAMLMLIALIAVDACVAKEKDRVYQPASVLSMENRKVGEREYGKTAHRIVQITVNVYRVQAGDTIYEIEANGHDPLGATSVGKTIKLSVEKNSAFVLVNEGK